MQADMDIKGAVQKCGSERLRGQLETANIMDVLNSRRLEAERGARLRERLEEEYHELLREFSWRAQGGLRE
eukprot:8612282-Lingulodinium_polyedra.AAC.1